MSIEPEENKPNPYQKTYDAHLFNSFVKSVMYEKLKFEDPQLKEYQEIRRQKYFEKTPFIVG